MIEIYQPRRDAKVGRAKAATFLPALFQPQRTRSDMTATILQFPQRNKGRVRKSTGARAEGMFAMHMHNATADNIEIFNTHREIDGFDYLAYTLSTIIGALPPEARQQIKRKALCDAALGKSDSSRIAGACLAGSFKRVPGTLEGGRA